NRGERSRSGRRGAVRLELHERFRDVVDGGDVGEDVVRDGDREAIFDVGNELHHAEAVEPEIVLDVIVRADRPLAVHMLLEDLRRDLERLVVADHHEPTLPPTGIRRYGQRRCASEALLASDFRCSSRTAAWSASTASRGDGASSTARMTATP